MKFTIRNKVTKELYPFNSRLEMELWCKSKDIKLNTLERALREDRDPNADYELVCNSKVRNSHLANMLKNETRVLVIGDLHEPFCTEGYLEFCKAIYERERCNQVVFTGDVIDGHAFSSHKAHNASMGVNTELDATISKLKIWEKAFPKAKVCIGNHELRLRVGNSKDLIIPDKVFRPLNEVLEVPSWEFSYEHIIDGVKYHHGIPRNPKQEALHDGRSVVCGHRHTEGYVHHFLTHTGDMRFGMQVGAALDTKSYASEYAKGSKQQHINVGVVIGGRVAYLIYMGGNNENKDM